MDIVLNFVGEDLFKEINGEWYVYLVILFWKWSGYELNLVVMIDVGYMELFLVGWEIGIVFKVEFCRWYWIFFELYYYLLVWMYDVI